MDYRSIEMNLKIGCPIKCNYCPQDTFLHSDYGTKKSLSKEDFSIILSNASFPDNTIEVYFAGFSEPLATHNWLELAEMCERHPKVSRFDIFTTGYKITLNQIKSLSNFKKMIFNIHVGDREDMPNFDIEIWNKLIWIKQYLPNAVFLEVGFDITKFTKINAQLDQHGLRHQFQKIISRAGNLQSVGLVQLSCKKENCAVTCEKMKTKTRPVILPDGTALACTNDYGCEMKIGNLITQKWDELDFQKIIELQKNCNSGLPCFRDCHFAEKDQSLTSKMLL